MEFFPGKPDAEPQIYAYEDTHPRYMGLLKVGYTTGDAKIRVAQQYPTKRPGGDRQCNHKAKGCDADSFTQQIKRVAKGLGWRV